MRPSITGTLAAPGASLYYEVRGSGPGLLLIPTGNGDAGPYRPLAAALSDRFTVMTYDRRGYSRSRLDGPVQIEQRLNQDVDDASLLLRLLPGPPAHVFGTCSGAIVAIGLLQRHPGSVRTVVAHEPSLASVLPDAERWLRFHTDLYDTYRRYGPDVAKQQFKASVGIGDTRPPEAAQPPADELAEMLARIRTNQVFWFEYEMRYYPAFQPDIAALRAVAGRLVLGGDRDAPDHFPYRATAALAARLGTGIVHFPGGHLGNVVRPFEFADILARVLTSGAG